MMPTLRHTTPNSPMDSFLESLGFLTLKYSALKVFAALGYTEIKLGRESKELPAFRLSNL